jgi:drug/metabolite transporter (DMT)-like permease
VNFLWVFFTVIAAAGQTARNAMQRNLTASLGAVGATHVRFLFGFPFAILFALSVWLISGQPAPHLSVGFWGWIITGALAQIVATALMLMTMEARSFVVTTAYLKTEPIFVAIGGLVLLGDKLTIGMMTAILLSIIGVVLISLRPGAERNLAETKPALMGLAAGAIFGLSAIGYRGAILALDTPHYVFSSSFALAVGLTFQAGVLSLWLRFAEPGALTRITRLWRPSLFAGFMGSFASAFWFLAFALATAASVRTLGLIDVLFAQALSHIVFKQKTTWREAAGITLLVAGAILIVRAHG